MAKLKKATLSMNNKEKSFAYEIIGIVSLLISLISIARFGIIGKYLVLAFSLMFGDWYFVFIGLVGLFGVYCLIFHKKIELKSIRYYGIILILLSLLIVSHFGMHEYVSQFEGNALKTTLRLYFEYFKTSSSSMIKGGGIIGCISFYLAYFLLGKVGTILISLILMFIGIVFLSKKTIKEFIEMLIRIIKKIFIFFKRKYQSVVENVIEISKDYNAKQKESKVKKRTNNKKEITKKNNLEVQRCEQTVEILKNTLEKLDVEIISISYLICEHIIVYFIKTKQEVNYKVLEFSLYEKLNDNYLIKYDKLNDQLLLEMNKENPTTLNYKQALKEISKEDYTIILGIDDRNLLVELDDNLLIICKNEEFLKMYLCSILTVCTLQKKHLKEYITLVDIKDDFVGVLIKDINIETQISYLGVIVEEIDRNLELLNLHHKKDIDEYNLYYQEKIVRKKYIIYGIENIIYKKDYFENLLYIIQTGSIAGINVVLTVSKNIPLSNVVLSSISKKLILKNDFDFSNKIIDNTYFDIINNNVEGFYKDKDLIIRICLLMMSEEEINSINVKKTS